jgi:soluble lytic murein transglycosylase-like protein
MTAIFLLNHNLRMIDQIATAHGLDWKLVTSIVQVESQGNPTAHRFEPNFKWFHQVIEHAKCNHCTVETEQKGQAFSYGLMQVMGATARATGYSGPLADLFDPKVNLDVGCKFLKGLLSKYEMKDAIAAYNAGTPRKKEDGKYVNQEYVDKVLLFYNLL